MLSPPPIDTYTSTPRQKVFAVVIAAFFIGAVLYKWLRHEDLQHTGLMFIGLPGVLAVILSLQRPTATAKGGIARGMALFLLMVAPLVGEGYLCILVASPIFFAVGLAVGALIDYFREKRRATLACAALLLVPFALEGVVPQLTHNRAQSVTVSRVVNAPAASVAAAIARPPDVSVPLPRLLRIGFPRPLATSGGGLALNDTRTVHFSGAEGDPPGDLVLRVDQTRPGFLRLVTVSDSSKLAQWIRWTSSDVAWTPVDATHTRVTCTLNFQRQLDPFWYFAPWEQIAARETAEHLITANATPGAR